MKRIVPKWWRRPHHTTYGHIVTWAGILCVAGYFIFAQITTLKDAQVARAKHDVLVSTYNTDFVEHARQMTEYTVCLANAVERVDRIDGLRVALKAITDFTDLFPDDPRVKTISESRAVIVDTFFPPLVVTEIQAACVAPSPAPVNPDS